MSFTNTHHGHRWLVKLVVKFIKDAEDDANTQIRIHKWFIRFWFCNFFAAITVFVFFPDLWATASVFYLVVVSLYANFATDYGALNASQGSLHALEAGKAVVRDIAAKEIDSAENRSEVPK